MEAPAGQPFDKVVKCAIHIYVFMCVPLCPRYLCLFGWFDQRSRQNIIDH